MCKLELHLRRSRHRSPLYSINQHITWVCFKAVKMSNRKYAPRSIPKGVFLLSFALLLSVLLLSLIRNLTQPSSNMYAGSLETTETRRCNIFSGHWAPYPKETYYEYDNETCPFIENQVNCLASGRPDREFIKLRWKPDECDLPLFDATQFMRLVRGKSLAFLGDSMGKNQMVSLMCLINSVSNQLIKPFGFLVYRTVRI